MTLRPKFYAKLVSAITRRRMNEHQRFLGESSQIFTQILNLLSKQDLKHFSNNYLLGFATIVFYNFTIVSAQEAPAGRLSGIPKPKYMTLGPKFYTKFVSSITRRRKQVRRNELHFQYTFSCALSFQPIKTRFKALFEN